MEIGVIKIIIITFTTIIVIGGALIIIFIKKKKKIQDPTQNQNEKEDLTQSNENDEYPNHELRDYIVTNKDKYSKDAIKEALLKAGTDKIEVEKYLEKYS